MRRVPVPLARPTRLHRLARAVRPRGELGRRPQPGLRRRRKRRSDLRQRLRRALQPGQLDRRPDRVDDPVRARRRHELADDSAQRFDPRGPLLPRPARLHGGGRRGDCRRPTRPERRTSQRPAARSRSSPMRPHSSCGAAAGSCSAVSSVRDLVGYGGATDFEGSGAAGALSSTLAAMRNAAGCTDSNDNSADFSAVLPTPRNSSAPSNACAGSAASDRREHAGRAGRRRRSGCALDQPRAVEPQLRPGACRHDAPRALGGGHRRRQPLGRLRAQRAPVGIHACRPAARRRVDGTARRPDRPRARRGARAAIPIAPRPTSSSGRPRPRAPSRGMSGRRRSGSRAAAGRAGRPLRGFGHVHGRRAVRHGLAPASAPSRCSRPPSRRARAATRPGSPSRPGPPAWSCPLRARRRSGSETRARSR